MSNPPAPDEAERAAREAAAAAVGDDFWGSHELLGQVRGWARARRVGPYALLGEIILQVMARVPPNVLLPPLGSIDGEQAEGAASLNQIIASVGPSGMSKGLAHAIATRVVNWPEGLDGPVYGAVGTGEGIAALFVVGEHNKDTKQVEMVRLAWSAVLTATEVDKFAALLGRKNATLGGTLRSAWSGEALGETNATADKRRYVERDGYRLGIVVHVQPGRGHALLNEEEAAGGTPQRILWLPARDPDIPETAPAAPGRLPWKPPAEVLAANKVLKARRPDCVASLKPLLLPVCGTALREIDRAAVARHRGEAEALDGHALLVREKVAASLAIFLGRFAVTETDWILAGHLMAVSDATRRGVERELRQAAERENDARGRAKAGRDRMVRDQEEKDGIEKAKKRIISKLGERADWMSRSDLRREAGQRHREFFDEAIELLAKSDAVEAREIERDASGHGGAGTEYRCAP